MRILSIAALLGICVSTMAEDMRQFNGDAGTWDSGYTPNRDNVFPANADRPEKEMDRMDANPRNREYNGRHRYADQEDNRRVNDNRRPEAKGQNKHADQWRDNDHEGRRKNQDNRQHDNDNHREFNSNNGNRKHAADAHEDSHFNHAANQGHRKVVQNPQHHAQAENQKHNDAPAHHQENEKAKHRAGQPQKAAVNYAAAHRMNANNGPESPAEIRPAFRAPFTTDSCPATVTATITLEPGTTTVTVTPSDTSTITSFTGVTYTTSAPRSACTGTSAICPCESGYHCVYQGNCEWECVEMATTMSSTSSEPPA